jgi:hypothetical protein
MYNKLIGKHIFIDKGIIHILQKVKTYNPGECEFKMLHFWTIR